MQNLGGGGEGNKVYGYYGRCASCESGLVFFEHFSDVFPMLFFPGVYNL